VELVGFGIIGCGAISKKHGEAISRIDGARLVAAADLVEENVRQFVSAYGGKSYEDYRDLLQDTNVDAVIIATPSGLHAKMGQDALDAGKHVLVEKPLAMCANDADRLTKKAQEVSRCLGTVHPNRYYATSEMIHKAIQDGRFGRLSHGVATVRWNRTQKYYEEAPWRKTREMDGGVLLNQAWHALDLLLWFMGPVSKVQGMTSKRLHDIETEDVALVTLEFESGALGLVEATTNVYPRNLEQTVSVFGEKGTVVLGGRRIDAVRVWRVEGDEDEKEVLGVWGEDTAQKHDPSWGHERVMRAFIEQLRSGINIAPEASTAAMAIRVIESVVGSSPGAVCE
jgi:UDP-N-acetyl-2-amino-2-deoxyglucuronate dehydrogenase